ncbi:hypothetical protein NSQ93_06235 [Bacillus sp. FSL W8-0445]|jgi:polyribonucleotide nucleotidyltransferase|uniref:DUF1257 domain-containing protein n=2 Tax=Bacillus licheniformis TaxID=1402 RepID=Q65D76_BACLD|nr:MULTISPECIES: hypothetical protein [Bacillus]AAU25609.1 hypothetical protein BL01927 [Bacillus licheniformis DSM 13 = ATCC 14580]AAU42988.1 hypothetical protein BLi04175 [Bacillus licheniformis DSM 13 = ATCC 14580]AMR12494.1 hypothetical protein AB684_20810 [Bacillus licheniformis]AOP17407.1 hypothetical protein BL1202_04487 [Bacillus licheniformis]ARC60999.1 hypothetical protein BaDB11_02359 [Bacillus licheniformis]
MSIEIVLLPVAIAATQAIASYLAENESGRLYTMPTVMKDEDLLKKALDQNGCKTIELGTTNVEAIMEDSAVTFHLTEEGTFKAAFDRSVDKNQAREFIDQIEEEYKRILQQETYLKLIEKAEHEGLVLENETVTNENSVVLTFKVNG